MVVSGKASGLAFASPTVSGSSGQPGVSAVKPTSSNSFAQRSQLLGNSQRPWTKMTGCAPVAFARWTCWVSCSVIVAGSLMNHLLRFYNSRPIGPESVRNIGSIGLQLQHAISEAGRRARARPSEGIRCGRGTRASHAAVLAEGLTRNVSIGPNVGHGPQPGQFLSRV